MALPFSYRETYRMLAAQEAGALTTLALCIAIGCLFTALGLAGAMGLAASRGIQKLPSTRRFPIQGEDIGLMVTAAGLAWAAWLWWYFRKRTRNLSSSSGPQIAAHPDPHDRAGWMIALAGTLLILAACVWGSIPIRHSGFVPGDRHLMLSIQWLVQGAAALLLWLPLQHRFECARLMQHSMISINIRCLRCGYAMSGLEHLRCPECGEEFTIDELLRGQPLVSGGEGSVERLPAQTISASVPTGAS